MNDAGKNNANYLQINR